MTESPAQAGAAIVIDGVTKRFGNQTAVDALSLSIPHGSIFGLIGENGAGKTTTIQMLLGLLKPTGGRIDVVGLDPVSRGLDVRRRVGYVPESPVLYDWMTVSEIGWFAAAFHLDAERSTSGYQYRYNELTRGFELPRARRSRRSRKGCGPRFHCRWHWRRIPSCSSSTSRPPGLMSWFVANSSRAWSIWPARAEPSCFPATDWRGRARGQPHRDLAPRQAAAGRDARSPQARFLARGHIRQPRPPVGAAEGENLEFIDAPTPPARHSWAGPRRLIGRPAKLPPCPASKLEI